MAIVRVDLKATSYTTVGLEIVLSVLFGFFGGHWLDGKLGTEPVLAVIGLGFGIATAARFLYRAAQRMKRDTARDGFSQDRTGRSARFRLDQKDERASDKR